MENNEIEGKRIYSKYEIVLLGVLGKTEPTVRKKIMSDMVGENILKAKFDGKGTRKRYKISGANLIKYLEI